MADEDVSDVEYEENLFNDAERDPLFIEAHPRDPETLDLIQNFNYMLGDPGEELLIVEAHPAGAEADGSAAFSDQFIDVDQIIAASAAADAASMPESADAAGQSGTVDIAALLEDPAASIDLDRLYDSMRLIDPPSAADLDYATSLLPPFSQPEQGDLTLASGDADALLQAASLDYLFRALLPADES
ncbi:hypothetical protein [Sneathiella sp.]|uniref:hypothetical protein n=1 Tax=Sneathiella sp. TaxID=1964365 RepID=UPI002FE0954A